MKAGRSRASRQSSDDPPPHARQLSRICGLASVRALFECDPGRVERLFFDDKAKGEVGRFCQMLASERKPYRQVDKLELARVAGTVLHGGVVAIARPRPIADFAPGAVREWAQDGTPLLILDGVANPHNLGAIVRSAAFFGVERIVLADRPDQALPSDASYRVAEGGFEHLILHRGSLPAALRELRQIYRVVGTALGERAAPAVWHGDRPVALVLGNEETGLDRATLAACDDVVTISGGGRVQSLNVAAAAAILIYSLTRR
jgi:TrmH RNA methyltransferase